MSARRSTSSSVTARRAALAVVFAVAACVFAWCGTALAATAPVLGETWVVNVASSSATLEAQINPKGAETSYRFEYGTSEAYGTSVPVPAGNAGAGTGVVTVQVHTQSLSPHTAYHYRVVASNADGTVTGSDHTFTTQSAGGELTLPDDRQWELVSPAVKEGGIILPLEEGGGAVQAAANGEAMTYLMTVPPEANPAGNANESQLLSTRTPEGWTTRNLEPPHNEADEGSVGEGEEYRVFSPDLGEAIVQPFTGRGGEALISPEATEYTIYRHDDTQDGGSGYLPLVTAANVPAGTKFKGEESGSGRVTFLGATPDLSHVVLSARAALTATPVEEGLYEWSQGQLQLISRFPQTNAPAACFTALGGENSYDARGAISNDGTRIVWYDEGFGAGGDGGEPCKGTHLYLRDTAKQETIQLDAVSGGSGTGPERPTYQLANSAGSRIFFTDSQELTAGAGSGESLYECEVVEVAGKLTCALSDLTIDEHAGQEAEAATVLGASEDGSYVYFSAGGALAAGASAGNCRGGAGATCNVYVRHDGATTFIGAASGEEVAAENGLRNLTARVSPNGRYLEFMSDRSLTGYDNHDANSGMPDEEVYLYDATSNRLVCASCDPTGARPVGVEVSPQHEMIAEHARIWSSGRWLAANVPGWTGMTLSSARYQSRYLSDSGRLFFNSSDALVPQDTNGTEDVYEYEPAGVGSCTTASATYGERSEGCVDLISAGTSASESAFLDASESGEDVFFMTTSQLVAQDFDEAYDVYDAHACSAASPCPASVVSSPPCTTADACRAAPAPQPAIFGAPASATFSGAGNVAPPAAKTTTKSKGKAKAKSKHKAKSKAKSKHKAKKKVQAKRRTTAKRERKRTGGRARRGRSEQTGVNKSLSAGTRR